MPAERRIPNRRHLAGLGVALLTLAARAQETGRSGPAAPRPGPSLSAEDNARLDGCISRLRNSTYSEFGDQELLTPEQEAELVGLVVSFRRGAWQVWIDRLLESPAHSADRRLAVRILGAGGRGADLPLLARIAQLEEDGDLLERTFAETFEPAITSLVARDPHAGGELKRTALETSIGVRRSLAHGLGGVGGARALEELAALLGFDEALDPTLLAQIAKVARAAPQPFDEPVLQQVRNCLLSEEPQILAAASSALAGLQDLESVDPLLELLAHETPSARGSAHRALKAICGVNFPAERARWEPWLAEERAWFADRAAGTIADLASENRMTLVAALNEIGMQRLYRRALSEEVLGLLERSDAQERALACQTLAQLGVRGSLPRLIEALDDEDDGVSAAAWTAVQEIAGDELPTEARAWAELNGLAEPED
jgi:HEAT repeat protein